MSEKSIVLKIEAQSKTNQAYADLSRLANKIQDTAKSTGYLSRSSNASAALADFAREASNAGSGVTKTAQGVESISHTLQRNQSIVASLTAAYASFSQISKLITVTDEYTQMASRIKMVASSTEKYETAACDDQQNVSPLELTRETLPPRQISLDGVAGSRGKAHNRPSFQRRFTHPAP
ncbi:MAG: hypothetical protein LBU53_03720 [Zoogloeaceae bacterium]|jgi:hypothetical protein|nr:hypothetical protein [Zoogloeaceae bacterium]